MPAPRLLDKKAIVASLATERKQEAQKGLKIAQKVDAVRATLTEEEERLERFRSETIKKVQIEIDAKIAERDALVREIEGLRKLLS